MPAEMPAKHTDPQAAMKTHLSQSTGTGAFDGQHGMSSAIWAIMSADISVEVISGEVISGEVISGEVIGGDVISSAIAGTGPCEDGAAITGRETGANARPAIIRIASKRRMAKMRFTVANSHRLVAMERWPSFNI
jgi:hypothetical protein